MIDSIHAYQIGEPEIAEQFYKEMRSKMLEEIYKIWWAADQVNKQAEQLINNFYQEKK